LLRVEILNHALEGIPEDRVRYHICWGSWHGPHTTDMPLRDIVDIMLRVKAQAYLVEAGNVRHEHEYKVWREVKLHPQIAWAKLRSLSEGAARASKKLWN
jgi:5-methyltetrahydropteroyltriglutamate--homocysteine methyltransferase